jgi:UDP-glucuronate decarboxylase
MDSDDAITGPINLGNPCEFTMLELAAMAIEIIGSRSRIDFHPLPADDPRQRKPDIAQAVEKLGWQPQVALRDGLERTIRYFEGLVREPMRVAEHL